MTKVKKFKTKTRKGAKKRLKISAGDSYRDSTLQIMRINLAHRLIGKSGKKKQLNRVTSLNKVHDKYKKVIF